MNESELIENAVYILGMAIGGLIEAIGMHAENQNRLNRNEPIAYTEEAFQKIINDRGLHHNAILTNLRGK